MLKKRRRSETMVNCMRRRSTRDCAVDIAMRWTNGYDTTIAQLRQRGGDARRRHCTWTASSNGITKQVRKAIEDNARKLKVNHQGFRI